MTITADDIALAKSACAAFQPRYRGPNPLTTGMALENEAERQEAVGTAWTAWSGFARGWFMAMLNTLGGAKPLALRSAVEKFCEPPEAAGAREAMDLFWNGKIALHMPGERRGGVRLNPLQLAILADDTIGLEVFRAVDQAMEAQIMQTLRNRRNFLQQYEPEVDHGVGLQEDIAFFFGGGKPARLSRAQRNENFDGMLFQSHPAPIAPPD
jgi:hypothetical protein